MLPDRRKPQRSHIERVPRRDFPRHRAFVRSHHCCVPGCDAGPIEFAHVRTAANSGTGLKPGDESGVSLCRDHHAEQHRIGAISFQKRHGIDLAQLAAEYAVRSPDVHMRDVLRQREIR